MLLAILQVLFPIYYKSVWNREFMKHMERFRFELYQEYPNNHDVVDRCIWESYKKWLK